MKKIINKYIILPFVALYMLTGCTDYLTTPPEADKTPEDIFGTYNSFQGYVDQIYLYIVDPMQMLTSDACFGGEAIGTLGTTTGYQAVRGGYAGFCGRGFHQYQSGGSTGAGVWGNGWRAIRIANIGLQNIALLENSDASQAEKDRIKGQLLFFRAYFHYEILAAWGSIPYVDKVLVDDFKLPRYYEYKGKKNYQACTEHIAEDMTEAAALLPAAWPSDISDLGRVTAFAALGYKAKALLFAGSPLMNEVSGNSAIVDVDYMKRAAGAAWELIKLSQETLSADGTKACELLPWTEYQQMFATTDRTSPWKKETIWGKYRNDIGSGLFTNAGVGRIQAPDKAIFGGNGTFQSVTQNFVDLFEMNDGTLYNSSYDQNNAKRWDARDPRFRKSVYVDRDMAGVDIATKLELYSSGGTANAAGRTKAADGCLTPYIIHKFWPVGVNKWDGARTTSSLYNNFRFMVPLMRLAEIYLIYAEAVNEGFGGANQMAPGATMTAVDAVNVVRSRAYQGSSVPVPLATASATQYAALASAGGPGAFTRLVLNERAVEMCFEGPYWYDLRRWKTGEKLNQTSVYDLQFDKAWTPTSFVRVEKVKRVFESPKHYWLPFQRSLTQSYKEFPQNEGWD